MTLTLILYISQSLTRTETHHTHAHAIFRHFPSLKHVHTLSPTTLPMHTHRLFHTDCFTHFVTHALSSTQKDTQSRSFIYTQSDSHTLSATNVHAQINERTRLLFDNMFPHRHTSYLTETFYHTPTHSLTGNVPLSRAHTTSVPKTLSRILS